MNFLKEAEQRLRDCRDMERSIRNMKQMREQLMRGPKPLASSLIDETGIRANKHNDTLNTMYEIAMLTRMIEETEQGLKQIYQILDDMAQDGEREKQQALVLKMWYIERKTKEEIAEALGYSTTSIPSVYDLRNEGLRTFAINLFGLPAAVAI